jgi:hypothetical protein
MSAQAIVQDTPADARRSRRQINLWLFRNQIALIDASTEDCARVAREYHTAIAADWDTALIQGRTEACPNAWHRSAPARRLILCPECPDLVQGADKCGTCHNYTIHARYCNTPR